MMSTRGNCGSSASRAKCSLLVAFLFALPAAAQQAPFTIEQVLSFSFPSELTAAPKGGRTAWVSNTRGVRNIMVAEPPLYRARKLTGYSEDDGQEIQDLRWTPDASALIYVRGGSANPALKTAVSRALWIVTLDGAPPRSIGEGFAPAVSPRGDRVAFIRGGQVWWAPLDGKAAPARAFQIRGECGSLRWSPEGGRLAFVSARGDHSFIAVYDFATAALRYLDPGTDFDSDPAWSPDGRGVAFIRSPSSGIRQPREARRTGEPWSIRVASAETGQGKQVWRASAGPGSVFRGISARNQLLWAAGDRLVFPWERDGWTHLYSISATGGDATLLTPGEFEVEDVAPAAGGREIVYSSNQGDPDRRHLWRVAAAGGAPSAVTSGEGIECSPAPSEGNAIAFLRSDARRPLHPAVRIGSNIREMDPDALPAAFPLDRMVAPQPVTFPAADGLRLHGQIFLPPGSAPGRAPAVVFFHGGPRRQMLLGWHYMAYYANAYALNQCLANAGFVVLSVNFRSGIGYGLDFREAPGYGASGAADYNDVVGAANFLRAHPRVDPARIGAWGGSYGGFLTALALARGSNLYRAGVDFHGVHDWAVELNIPLAAPDYKLAYDSSPMNFVDTWRSPVLLIHGDDDPDVQFKNTVMLAYALRKRGVDAEELIIPDETHEFLLHRTWVASYGATFEFLSRKLR